MEGKTYNNRTYQRARYREEVEFNGLTFYRYPSALIRERRVYFRAPSQHRARGVGYLHQEVWKAAHGPIPEGYHIHHIDHDPLNNALENLAAVPAAEHQTHHHAGQATPAKLAHLERIRYLTKAWHASEEGRRWHSQHGIDAWAKRQPIEKVCDQCSAAFECMSRRDNDRFCSNKCKSAWRRASGLDDVDKTCVTCGATFRANKYAKSRNCSRACGAKFRAS